MKNNDFNKEDSSGGSGRNSSSSSSSSSCGSQGLKSTFSLRAADVRSSAVSVSQATAGPSLRSAVSLRSSLQLSSTAANRVRRSVVARSARSSGLARVYASSASAGAGASASFSLRAYGSLAAPQRRRKKQSTLFKFASSARLQNMDLRTRATPQTASFMQGYAAALLVGSGLGRRICTPPGSHPPQ